MKNGHMSRARASRVAVAAVLALLFAGSAASAMASALAIEMPAAALYAPALVAALLCAVGAVSGVGAAVAALAFIAVSGLYAASNAAGFRALPALFDAWAGRQADPALAAAGARTLMTCGAFTLGAFFFAPLNSRELPHMAIMVLLAVFVACHAMSKTASMAATAPGLVAAAAAFALTGGLRRDLSALRALAPAALAVALAFMLAPGEGVTWGPLEDAANRVRGVFEQYFRFTRERVAFTIGQEGYDHAGEVGDDVVSMLGGPASPRTDPVMRVRTDADALLRGAIRTAYTGWSWIDAAPKNRYLYYDLTHRAIRDRVFEPDGVPEAALMDVEVSVEMLDAGTSTLFVPGYMNRFEMPLSVAVYYNTAGEMFLAREVQSGDAYRLRARLPVPGEALRDAVLYGADSDDPRYREALATHTDLPAGIEGGVYTLTGSLIQGLDNDFDRAMAIMNYLRANMRYTLQPEMPPQGRDFVSHFLLDTREGYCSYYASAMAVMGRVAGLPTRYVEGYLARPDREILTGEDAHAWAEVYFRGVGWIPFDATGGTTAGGAGNGGTEEDAAGTGGEGDGAEEDARPAEGDLDGLADAPTPTPTIPPEDAAAPQATPEPSEAPGEAPPEDGTPEAQTPPPDAEAPSEAPSETPTEAPRRGGAAWLWMLLLLLAAALVALAVRWVRARLRRSDPALLCREAGDARQAAMILYRANLTLLGCVGQGPAGGEAPMAFADRVSEQMNNPDYAAFVRAVTDAGYARRPLRSDDVDTGLRAYARFRAALTRRERLRFTLVRVRRGLGDFEVIP